MRKRFLQRCKGLIVSLIAIEGQDVRASASKGAVALRKKGTSYRTGDGFPFLFIVSESGMHLAMPDKQAVYTRRPANGLFGLHQNMGFL